MYDAYTGQMILTLVNPAFGTAGLFGAEITYDQSGDMLVYMLGNNWLAMWNSSLAIPLGATTGSGVWNWRPGIQEVIPWSNGIEWNVTVPDVSGQGICELSSNVVLATQSYTTVTPAVQEFIGYSATTGQRMWAMNITAYQDIAVIAGISPIVNDTFTYFDEATMQTSAYSALTGAQLWVSAPKTNDWNMYSDSYRGAGPPNPQIAYGNEYSTGFGGQVYCYSLETGKTLWTFTVPNSGTETPYGDYPLYGGATIADGKVYVATGDHSPSEPLWRGGALYCLNATTGKELWSISGWMPGSIIADGSLVTFNNYDGQIYCFGKGQTATTVTTTPVLNNPAQVLIKGTVTDQSPGQTCLGIPAAGTPAISDASMTQWMEYLYQQQPEPMNATGVPVTLSYTDPNGNTYTMGTTTSDITGQYSYTFTPTIPGTYKITATFCGSNSYYSSTTQSIMSFDLPATTAAPTATPTSVANLYFVPAIAGLFVLIIAVLAVVILQMLRKRQ